MNGTADFCVSYFFKYLFRALAGNNDNNNNNNAAKSDSVALPTGLAVADEGAYRCPINEENEIMLAKAAFSGKVSEICLYKLAVSSEKLHFPFRLGLAPIVRLFTTKMLNVLRFFVV